MGFFIMYSLGKGKVIGRREVERDRIEIIEEKKCFNKESLFILYTIDGLITTRIGICLMDMVV